MAEREIKTVLTLEDASFTKGLKEASSSVSAAKAEMNAAISSAGGLGKGFKQASAQMKGLSNILKAQKNQMSVISKEYKKQVQELDNFKKAAEKAKKENGEGSKEAEQAANAYSYQSAKVNELRVKMANLTVEMNKSKDAMRNRLTIPLQNASKMLKSFSMIAVSALATGAAAIARFTEASNESKSDFNSALAESRGAFGKWSLFLEEEAKKAWSNLGLSQAAYLETASQIGATLQEGGMGVQQSAEWVTQAMELAGKLKDEYGVPVETVLNDIARAANGDARALEKYGVKVSGINANMSGSDAAAKILKEAMDSAGESAKLLDGQVAKSVDDSGKKLKSAWENFKAGVGSSEDVATAAVEAAASFGGNFAENLGTFIKVAPETFDAFAASFSENWEEKVWKNIKDYFEIELHIKIPEWDDIKKPLENIGKAIQRLWDSIFPGQATRKTALEIQLQSTWDNATSDLDLKTEPYTIQNPDKAETKSNIEQWWDDLKQNIALSLGVSVNPQQQEKEQQWLEDNFRFYPNGFAGGLWNVPKNDFMARLHSGEMVLTASQAARYRAQAASGGNIVNNNNSSAMYIDKYYQNSETDAKALLEAMNAMQRRQRKGYGMA